MGEKNIVIRVHDSYRWVVAICDKELLGRVLLEGNRKLDLSGPFFQGTAMDEAEAMAEIERCVEEDANFNIVGPCSVAVALKAGIIHQEGVMNVQGVPYALALL